MRKLKLRYFGHSMQRANSLEKTLMLGKIEGRRMMGWQRMGLFDDIANSTDMNLSKLQEIVKDRGAWSAAAHRVAKSWTQLTDWTTTFTITTVLLSVVPFKSLYVLMLLCGVHGGVIVTESYLTLCDPMNCGLLGSSVMGFSSQEYYSGLPFPSPGDLPYPVIKPGSPALQADSLLS